MIGLARALWRMVAALRDPEGRRGAALLFMASGGVSLTMIAGAALWLVRMRAQYVFYLGAGSLVLIGIVLTGFAGLLIKRTIKGSLFGNNFEISDQAAAAIGAAAVAAVSAAKGEAQ